MNLTMLRIRERPRTSPGRVLYQALVFSAFILMLVGRSSGADASAAPVAGILYTNMRISDVPWSIHVVRVDRNNRDLEVRSLHAGEGTFGLDRVSGQLEGLKALGVRPVAAINGDFYAREGRFAGRPRGMQVVDGEVIAPPSGGPVFWTDVGGNPNLSMVASRFHVVWPNGATNLIDLNGNLSDRGATLYSTPGLSLRFGGGRMFVLDPLTNSNWLPLRPEKTYQAVVRQSVEGGTVTVPKDSLVLAVGPRGGRGAVGVTNGSVLTLSMATTADLRGCRMAVGGGPFLLRKGKKAKLEGGDSDSYESSSMLERHPRSAVGWNDRYLYLVEVDGRQRPLSVGMDLPELATFLARLGCTEGMNLDGGGSATFWYDGRVRNKPCDGRERPVANCVVIALKPSPGKSETTP